MYMSVSGTQGIGVRLASCGWGTGMLGYWDTGLDADARKGKKLTARGSETCVRTEGGGRKREEKRERIREEREEK